MLMWMQEQRRPIIWVVHSMGGLVVKKARLSSLSNNYLSDHTKGLGIGAK